MLRREMRSKRGSLPPKKGDLTCMKSSQHAHIVKSVLQNVEFSSPQNMTSIYCLIHRVLDRWLAEPGVITVVLCRYLWQ